MRESREASLSPDQYGFVEGRSTCDALLRVKGTVVTAFSDGGMVVAVGIDVVNAFNSLPWATVREALRIKSFPEYIRRILDAYLFNRSIEVETANGLRVRPVEAGVPQGSVLGPLL